VVEIAIPINVSGIERKHFLMNDLLPLLLKRLLSRSESDPMSTLMSKIITTVTVGGFMRNSHTRDLGMPDSAWTTPYVEAVYSHILGSPQKTNLCLESDYIDRWMAALSTQACICEDRRIALLDTNGLGLVPGAACTGDIIAILHGLTIPVVLRPKRDGYQLIGPCFVDGIMYGSAVTWEEGNAQSILLM
jgi:hypothetical protein